MAEHDTRQTLAILWKETQLTMYTLQHSSCSSQHHLDRKPAALPRHNPLCSPAL